MKKLEVSIACMATYNSHIMVEDNMTLEEAIEYANNNLNLCNIESPLEYISDSDTLDEENCFFEGDED